MCTARQVNTATGEPEWFPLPKVLQLPTVRSAHELFHRRNYGTESKLLINHGGATVGVWILGEWNSSQQHSRRDGSNCGIACRA